MPKVSVIIPVYNVEPYLRQCLDSVVNQTLKDIEIICVNDGSEDDSLSILTEYAAKDKRMIVLNQENRGAGAARNRGLKIAKGEYLSFLDADDFFELNMLKEAYTKCKKTDADFIVFRSDIFLHSTNLFKTARWTIKDKLLPDVKVFCYRDIEKDLFRVFIGWAWDKMFKRKFVTSNKLYFQELRTTNDLFFVFTALVQAKRIAVLHKVLAHHRKRRGGSLSLTREKSWDCFFIALVALRDKLQELNLFKEVKQSYINYALHFSLWNLSTITGTSFEHLYHKLKNEYFAELGVPMYPESYFYNETEYVQYLKIRNTDPTTYLLSKINDLQKDISRMKRTEKQVGIYKYKICRAIKFIPRSLQKFFRSWKKRGLIYTLRLVRQRIF